MLSKSGTFTRTWARLKVLSSCMPIIVVQESSVDSYEIKLSFTVTHGSEMSTDLDYVVGMES